MKGKSVVLFVFLIFATLVAALPALAGGWAVITLDELPGDIQPGKPVEIGFMVRQHGKEPMKGLDATISLIHPGTGEKLVIPAEPGEEPGYYRATLNLPSEGRWEWSIQAFTMNQEMPPLTVVPAAPVTQAQTGINFPLPLFTVGLGIALTLAALVILLRKRTRWAFALVFAGIFLGGFGFLSATAGKPAPEPVLASETSLEETGRDLFLAKGCITCHYHESVQRTTDSIYVDDGPKLSTFTADADYLRSWLKDPRSIKPKTSMPNLELDEGEIEALIAFLNAD